MNIFFSKWNNIALIEKIYKTEDREYMNELLYYTLEVSPDTKGHKIPRIGLIPPNIVTIEKPEKQETTKNMKVPIMLILFNFIS